MGKIKEIQFIGFIKEEEIYLHCFYEIDTETGETCYVTEEVDNPILCAACSEIPQAPVTDGIENNRFYEVKGGEFICAKCHRCYEEFKGIDEIEKLFENECYIKFEDVDWCESESCGVAILPDEERHLVDFTDFYELNKQNPKLLCKKCYDELNDLP